MSALATEIAIAAILPNLQYIDRNLFREGEHLFIFRLLQGGEICRSQIAAVAFIRVR